MKMSYKVFLPFVSLLFSFGALNTATAAESPMVVTGATTVDVTATKKLFDDEALFVDTRSDKDWSAGRIPDALHLNVKKTFTEDALLAEAKKDDAIVIYCNGASCMRSSKAAKMAVDWGFTNIYYFRDGFPAWKVAGYAVE